MDMCFWWLTDRVAQQMFNVSWAPGHTNLADYFSKHQTVKHVQNLHPLYTSQTDSPRSLQGCVKLLALAVSPCANHARSTDFQPNPVVELNPVTLNPVTLIPFAERSTDRRRLTDRRYTSVSANRYELGLKTNKSKLLELGFPPSKSSSLLPKAIISGMRMVNTRLLSSLIF